MKFGEDSTRLSTGVEFFVYWLDNESPPRSAYRAFVSVRLITLDKQTGVRLVDVG